MKKGITIIVLAFGGLFCFFGSCNSGKSADKHAIATDDTTIQAGEALFTQYCIECHNLTTDGMGPRLGSITNEVPVSWIQQFIKNPKEVIESGDERALQLFDKYKRSVMPSFASLEDGQIDAIIAFLHSNRQSPQQVPKKKAHALPDPIPDSIPLSSLVVRLQSFIKMPASNAIGKMPQTRITKLASQPGTGKLFVIDLNGKLYTIKENKPLVYMDISRTNATFITEPGIGTGFGSFAFHPDFPANGLLYTSHTETAGSGRPDFRYDDSIPVSMQWVITEWKANNPEADTFSGTSRELLRINMVAFSHGVQEITFNPLSKKGDKDYGLLYIGVGDGGCVQLGYPYVLNGKESVWGTILRIDPIGRNSANGQYGIPVDNPFASYEGTPVAKEIYAYGFRNPHRITWTEKGEMLAFNIGQANIESIYRVLPGHNYGWPNREGSFAFEPTGDLNSVYPLPANDSLYNYSYPIAEYDHDEGLAIAGGFEYWGPDIPQLNGKLLFGDIPSGRLFYIDVSTARESHQARIQEWSVLISNTVKSLKEQCECDRVELRFGKDSKGELYVLTKSDGRIYKLISAVDRSGYDK